jgi:hypothetical protein
MKEVLGDATSHIVSKDNYQRILNWRLVIEKDILDKLRFEQS